jgi:uncharacterized damage-inducible protein DinB
MISFFKELFNYNHYQNQSVIEAFDKQEEMLQQHDLKLFSHILNAHQVWNTRVDKVESPFGIWDTHPLKKLPQINARNYEASIDIIDRFALTESVSYVNSRGESHQKSLRDILFHIVNHSTHHRAQIMLLWRQFGKKPLSTDYIYYNN